MDLPGTSLESTSLENSVLYTDSIMRSNKLILNRLKLAYPLDSVHNMVMAAIQKNDTRSITHLIYEYIGYLPVRWSAAISNIKSKEMYTLIGSTAESEVLYGRSVKKYSLVPSVRELLYGPDEKDDDYLFNPLLGKRYKYYDSRHQQNRNIATVLRGDELIEYLKDKANAEKFAQLIPSFERFDILFGKYAIIGYVDPRELEDASNVLDTLLSQNINSYPLLGAAIQLGLIEILDKYLNNDNLIGAYIFSNPMKDIIYKPSIYKYLEYRGFHPEYLLYMFMMGTNIDKVPDSFWRTLLASSIGYHQYEISKELLNLKSHLQNESMKQRVISLIRNTNTVDPDRIIQDLYQ